MDDLNEIVYNNSDEMQEELPAIQPLDDGKVDAEGSVWKLYFAPGATPTVEQIVSATGAVKAAKTYQADMLARVTPIHGGK